MHSSTFHYNLSRPYPYRWFTPVTVVAGLALAALFSVMNLGGSGYYLAAKYSTEPNSTQAAADSMWFLKAPFNWGNSLKPQCEPLLIPVGYDFFTTNSGLHYTVTGVTKDDPSAQQPQVLASLSYLNNELKNCTVDGVTLALQKADESKTPSNWFSWSANSEVSAHCTIATPEGQFTLAMTTSFADHGTFDNHNDYAWLVTQNYTTHASLWWGARLALLRFLGTKQVMSKVVYAGGGWNDIVFATMIFHSNGTDPRSYDYFDMQYYYLLKFGGMLNKNMTNGQMYNNASMSLSPAMTEGLQYAKTIRALVEIDLGVKAEGNMLLSDDMLQYGILAPDDFNRQNGGALNATTGLDWFKWNGINWPGTKVNYSNVTALNETFPLFKDVTGPLGSQAAFIFGQYACSVPVQKNIGTLLVAVLLADLVFLQAVWKLFNLIVGCFVTRADERAAWCAGCLDRNECDKVGGEALEGDHDSRGQRRDSRSSVVG